MGRVDVYYEITDLKLIAKLGDGPYIYDPKQGWVIDKEFRLLDRLLGYDASEPKDSPYAIGNTDMLNRVREISKEEAEKLIAMKYKQL